MVSYRYYTCDLLTGNLLGDLPLYGVYADRKIGYAGNFTGTFKLGTGLYLDSDLLASSIPGRTAVYIERNGVLIWGGILWSRTYSTDAKTCELTGQTFESFFDHVVIEKNFIQQGIEQTTIFKNLVNALQAQENCNIGLTFGTIPATGVKRTSLIPYYEYHFAQEVIDDLTGADDAFEFTIDVQPTATQDHPEKLVRIGYPTLGDPNATELYFDYPGNVDSYYWPESATNGGVKFAALGYGSGNKIRRATAVNGDMITNGWPAWWMVNNYPMIADLKWLAAKAKANAKTYKAPVSLPTFTLKSDVGAGFTGWNNLGDNFTIHIEDERFPNGQDIVDRMIGWALTTADSDNVETLVLSIEGGDLAA